MDENIPEHILKHYPNAKWAEGSKQEIVALMGAPINWPCFICKEIMKNAEVWVNSEWQHEKCIPVTNKEKVSIYS